MTESAPVETVGSVESPHDPIAESSPGSVFVDNDIGGSVGGVGGAETAFPETFKFYYPVESIAIVGDSVYYNPIDHGGLRLNSIVGDVQQIVRSTEGLDQITVRNLSYPGLALKYDIVPLEQARYSTFRSYIEATFNEWGDNPDAVVLPVTTIDINVNPDLPIEVMAPELIAEMDYLRNYLGGLGIQLAIVPAFGVNDKMFNDMQASFPGHTYREFGVNDKIDYLNTVLRESDLPLLFESFVDKDLDGDGDVDETSFTEYDVGGFPDDGTHPNSTGQTVIAGNIGPALSNALFAGSPTPVVGV